MEKAVFEGGIGSQSVAGLPSTAWRILRHDCPAAVQVVQLVAVKARPHMNTAMLEVTVKGVMAEKTIGLDKHAAKFPAPVGDTE